MVRLTSQDKMKIKNYTQILEVVMNNPGINRKKISHLTNLSNQTLSNLVKELSDFGYITEFSLEDSSGFGRKPIGLSMNAKAFTIISVELTIQSLCVCLNTCDGQVIWSVTQEVDASQPILEYIKEGIEHALSNACNRVFAIVMSAEGIIDEEQKKLTYVKSLALKDVDLAKELSYFDLPFFLVNDTNLLCSYVKVHNPDLVNFMVVKLDTGIGCSIALNRNIQKTNESSMPGKLGHLKVINTHEKNACWCGGTNCLSTFLSMDNLSNRFDTTYERSLEVIRDAGPAGYQATIVEVLSPILANITVLLGIEKIFLGGRMVDTLGQRFLRRLDMQVAPSIPSWVNFMGIEEMGSPSIPQQCSSFFIHYFLEHILEYLQMVDETPFRVGS